MAEPAARLKGILDMQAQLLPIIRHMDRLLDAIATTCAGKVIIGGSLTVSHKRCFRAFGLEVPPEVYRMLLDIYQDSGLARYTLELAGCSAEAAQQMYQKAHLLAVYQGNKVCIHLLSVHVHIYIRGRMYQKAHLLAVCQGDKVCTHILSVHVHIYICLLYTSPSPRD